MASISEERLVNEARCWRCAMDQQFHASCVSRGEVRTVAPLVVTRIAKAIVSGVGASVAAKKG